MRRLGICLLFLALLFVASVNAQVEYAPGERRAEALFNMGIGRPWLISEHAPWLYGCTTMPARGFSYRFYDPFGGLAAEYRDRRYSSLKSISLREGTVLGYVTVDSGMLSVLDADTQNPIGVVKIHTRRGAYPVIAMVDRDGYLRGVYIDLRYS
ncbi:MAG: hypothetical protein QW781_04605 [Methanothrix sp.]|uniref:hypothetical protein n=1 Tax=Methanothrix sp. TaxID=90426 RepID=UPI00315F7903|nr:hypothetical protein [Methanothrix sp.]